MSHRKHSHPQEQPYGTKRGREGVTHVEPGVRHIRGQGDIVGPHGLVEGPAMSHQDPLGPDSGIRPPAGSTKLKIIYNN